MSTPPDDDRDDDRADQPDNLDPRLRRLLPTPLTPEQEAAISAALMALGPLEHTPAYDAWLARMERLTPDLEAALAAARATAIPTPHAAKRPAKRPRRPLRPPLRPERHPGE